MQKGIQPDKWFDCTLESVAFVEAHRDDEISAFVKSKGMK